MKIPCDEFQVIVADVRSPLYQSVQLPQQVGRPLRLGRRAGDKDGIVARNDGYTKEFFNAPQAVVVDTAYLPEMREMRDLNGGTFGGLAGRGRVAGAN